MKILEWWHNIKWIKNKKVANHYCFTTFLKFKNEILDLKNYIYQILTKKIKKNEKFNNDNSFDYYNEF